MHSVDVPLLIPLRLRLAVLALAVVSPALACDDAPDAEARDDAPDGASDLADDADAEPSIRVDALADGEIRVHGTPVADLELPRGPRLVFIDLAAPDEPPAIGVYEYVPTGHAGTERFQELAGATPLELFHAATTADVAVPPRLLATASTPEDLAAPALPRARGWLIPAVAEALLPRGICTDSDFTDAVEAYGYTDNGTPVLRLNKDPATSAYFTPITYTYIPEMAAHIANMYTVTGNDGSISMNVDAYYTRVAVCALGSHAQTCGSGGCIAHPGPTVNIGYRNDDDQPSGYQNVVNHDYAGTGYSHWHWQSGSNWDWRTRIHHAEDGDVFDIGHAVHID